VTEPLYQMSLSYIFFIMNTKFNVYSDKLFVCVRLIRLSMYLHGAALLVRIAA